MLDVYEYKTGTFEVVDTQYQELRARRVLYYRLIKFVIVLLSILILTFILVSYITSNFVWLLVIILPSGLIVFSYQNLKRLENILIPEISSILLEFDLNKKLQTMKIRKWTQSNIDEFIEEDVRFNQAIGFKVIWFDDGYFEIQIIVDREFPGEKIFGTYDFLVVAEFKKFFGVTVPSLSTWMYQLEDNSAWPEESLTELNNEAEVAKIPFTVREYFTEL